MPDLDLNQAYFTITSSACKVCNSSLRTVLDQRLLKKETKTDGSFFTQDELVEFAAEHGLEISQPALSRHLANHIRPGLQALMETQNRMEAIEKATGKRLALPSIFSNIILNKTVAMMDEAPDEFWQELTADPKLMLKMISAANTAAKHATLIERAEGLIDKGRVVEAVSENLGNKGITEETIRQIESEILGM